MSGPLASVLITGMFFFSFYKLCELFVMRKERRAIIDKISEGLPADSFKNTYFKQRMKVSKSGALHIGCLMIGVGLGIVLASVIDISISPSIPEHSRYRMYDSLNILYPSLSLLFGGIGLVVSYVIVRKEEK